MISFTQVCTAQQSDTIPSRNVQFQVRIHLTLFHFNRNKKNGQALGLMQATVLPVVWQDYNHYGVANDLFDALEAAFGKAGGASTYLQLVNMVKIQFTNSTDLLSQIQQFQDNYNQITSNGHSRLSEDLPSCFAQVFPTHTN